MYLYYSYLESDKVIYEKNAFNLLLSLTFNLKILKLKDILNDGMYIWHKIIKSSRLNE